MINITKNYKYFIDFKEREIDNSDIWYVFIVHYLFVIYFDSIYVLYSFSYYNMRVGTLATYLL